MALDSRSPRSLSPYESYVTSVQDLKAITSGLSDKIAPTCITSVQNLDLWSRYHEQKQEYLWHLDDVQEVLLWHATAECNVESILTNNFDCSRAVRSRYGYGVCFSADASYANQYCNRKSGHRRALIGTIVLVGNVCVGYPSMQYPAPNCDTSIGRRGLVYVKFGCNEFYPAFVVYYEHDDNSTAEASSFSSMNVSHINCETDELSGFTIYQSPYPRLVGFSNNDDIGDELLVTHFVINNGLLNLQTFDNRHCNNTNYPVNNWIHNAECANINDSYCTDSCETAEFSSFATYPFPNSRFGGFNNGALPLTQFNIGNVRLNLQGLINRHSNNNNYHANNLKHNVAQSLLTQFNMGNVRLNLQGLINRHSNNNNYHANNLNYNVGSANINDNFCTGSNQPTQRYGVCRQTNNSSHYINRKPFQRHGIFKNTDVNRKRNRSLDSNEDYPREQKRCRVQ